MPQIRLIGLILFITGVVLGLAAAATRTTHISVSDLWVSQTPPNPNQAQARPENPFAIQDPAELTTEGFTRIPVAWPLLGLGGLGLCLWFMQPTSPAQRGKASYRKRRIAVPQRQRHHRPRR